MSNHGNVSRLSPLASTAWPQDLSQLHGNLLRCLYAADNLLSLASAPGTEETLCDTGLALAKACHPLGQELFRLLPEMQAAHRLSGADLPAFAQVATSSVCELVHGVIDHVAGMFLQPLDATPGPVHWNVQIVRSKGPSEHTERIRERLRTVERFNVGTLRQLLENEIGLAARLRSGAAERMEETGGPNCESGAEPGPKGRTISDSPATAIDALVRFVQEHRGNRPHEEFSFLLELDGEVGAHCRATGINLPPDSATGSDAMGTVGSCRIPVTRHTLGFRIRSSPAWFAAMQSLRREAEMRAAQMHATGGAGRASCNSGQTEGPWAPAQDGAGEGKRGGKRQKKRRGQPHKSTPDADKKIHDDWKSSGLTQKEFARARGEPQDEIEAASKRHRTRESRQRSPRRRRT
jgi:hypothetical protein